MLRLTLSFRTMICTWSRCRSQIDPLKKKFAGGSDLLATMLTKLILNYLDVFNLQLFTLKELI